MSAKPLTKSNAKRIAWDLARERDRAAIHLMEIEDIPFWEALAKVLDLEEDK